MKITLVNFCLVVVMVVGTLISCVFYYCPNLVFHYVLMIPLLLFPFLLWGSKFQLGNLELFYYYSFLFFSYFLGFILDFYNKIFWYDIFVHFMSGFLSFKIGRFILERLSIGQNHFWFRMLFCLSVVMFVAGAWELFEYGVDYFLGLDLQHHIDTGVVDTMEDILVAFLAGILSIVGHFLYRKIT